MAYPSWIVEPHKKNNNKKKRRRRRRRKKEKGEEFESGILNLIESRP